MATITPTGTWIAKGVHQTTWDTVTSGDVCAAQSNARLPDKSVFITGALDGGGVTLQGSNNTATGPWGTLHDPQGNDLTLTATSVIEQVLENPLFIRATSSGGSGSMSFTLYVTEKSS